MRKKTVFFTHSAAAYALYVLGNAVIVMPLSTANEFTFLGYMAACILGFAFFAVAIPLLNRVFLTDTQKSGKFKKSIICLFYFLTALFALWCGADAFKSFTGFASRVMLNGMSPIFAVGIFFLVVLYFSFRRQEDILKFCLIAFWLVLAVVLFFFVACIARYNLRNIFV
jgi:hypothetical protein